MSTARLRMYRIAVAELREHASVPRRAVDLRPRRDQEQRADHEQERQRVGEERGAGAELGQHEAGQRRPERARPVNCIAFSRTALTMASGGTSWGTYACQAAMVMPAPMAPTMTTATISAGVATPVTQMPQSASAPTS